MKKILIPSIIVLFLCTSLFAQTPERVVLIEEGTGTGCQWCPRGEVFGQTLLEAFPGKIAYVAVHGFNTDDPMYFETYNEYLNDGGALIYPVGVVNRTDILGIDDPATAPSNVSMYVFDDPLVNVYVDTDYDEVSGNLNVTLSTELFATLVGDYRFAAIVIEDGVTGPAPAYDQSNAYAGGDYGPMGGYENLPSNVPASLMVYNHVARYLEGEYLGVEGSLPFATIHF